MKKTTHHLIAEVPRRQSRVELTIGIDLGDVWSHYCTLNEDGQVVDRGRFRTTPKAIDKWFTDVPHARVAMEAGTHSIWISEQLQELGHEVIVANVRELRAISHSDRKSDQVDAEKLARYARLDPEILRPIAHRTVEQQEALTLIRARDLLVRLRTAAVNAVRGLTKSCGHRMPASSTRCFAKRSLAVMPLGLQQSLGPVLQQIAEMTLKIKQYDRQIQLLTQTEYPETQALLKVQGVGHITALTFVLTLGNKERFKRSRDVGCYLGLRLFRDVPGAIANTSELSSRLTFELDDLGYEFPLYPVPDGETMDSFLLKRTEEGVIRRYGAGHNSDLPKRAKKQIEHELALIARLGFAGYFLIVWDIVQFCKRNGILIQGRGSAANSAVCYALEITAVDPVGMELLFERFLSENRGSGRILTSICLPRKCESGQFNMSISGMGN